MESLFPNSPATRAAGGGHVYLPSLTYSKDNK